MTTPIECRVINLDRREDRLTQIAGRLDAAGIAWLRQPAVDARAEDGAALAARIPGNSRAYPMSHVERACAASHLAAWRDFLGGGADALCVLEDDVMFDPDLGILLRDDGWLTPDHGLVKLDANSTRQRKALVSDCSLGLPLNERIILRMWSRRLGGGGYIAHRRVIEELARLHARPQAPIDLCLFSPGYAPQFRTCGVRIIEPTLIYHDHEGSDLQQVRQDQSVAGSTWRKTKAYRELAGLAAIPGRLRAMLFDRARFRRFGP